MTPQSAPACHFCGTQLTDQDTYWTCLNCGTSWCKAHTKTHFKWSWLDGLERQPCPGCQALLKDEITSIHLAEKAKPPGAVLPTPAPETHQSPAPEATRLAETSPQVPPQAPPQVSSGAPSPGASKTPSPSGQKQTLVESLDEKIRKGYLDLEPKGERTTAGILLAILFTYFGFGISLIPYGLFDLIVHGLGDLFIGVFSESILYLALMSLLPIIIYPLTGYLSFYIVLFFASLGSFLGKNRSRKAVTVILTVICLVYAFFILATGYGREITGQWAVFRTYLRSILLLAGLFGGLIHAIKDGSKLLLGGKK